jgi:two-component system, response regulator PdtaR
MTNVTGQSGAKIKILVVEDDFLVGMDIEHALVSGGFEIIGPARSAQEAIDLAQSAAPALAIMDIRIEGARDGVDAAIELRSRFGLRVIFASAHGDGETRRRAAAAQPLGWIEKPYSHFGLLAAVRAALTLLPGSD